MSSMEVITVSEIAAKWGVSERSVRNYCASGRVLGAFLVGKTWNIPATATKPERKIRASKNSSLLTVLRDEMQSGRKGGIYHHIQIEMTYNSNHIEGSCLSHEATRYIFETNTIGITKDKAINVDDVIETVNHFRCIDMVIRNAEKTLSETMIKKLHLILKSGTRDSNKSWFKVGDYKKIPNEVGGIETTEPENVASELKALLKEHNEKPEKTFDDLLDFHVRFERIHPFQDGNGRVGRLILFKECLKNNIVPFIITDEIKMFYYRGLQQWNNERGYLRDTCLTAQDQMKETLNYFRIPYTN